MFLDQEIIEKGIGGEKISFGTTWASPRIPDVSGMSGAIKQSVPLWPSQFISFHPTQPMPSSSPRATEAFTKKRERGRLRWRRLGSRTYMLLDQEITEKGIGREKTYYGTTWASPRIPDVSGMSRAIRQSVPFWPRQFCLFPTIPADALLLS